jgi:NTP pyrophosphatase (non-canonical NTP hydrolase)
MQIFDQYKTDLENGFRALQTIQRVVSGAVPGAIPGPEDRNTKDAVRTYTLAMMVEIAEWVQTVDWKPWKNHDADSHLKEHSSIVAEEFADILAFLGILMIYMDNWNIDATEVAEAYLAKSEVNMRRITDNLRIE